MRNAMFRCTPCNVLSICEASQILCLSLGKIVGKDYRNTHDLFGTLLIGRSHIGLGQVNYLCVRPNHWLYRDQFYGVGDLCLEIYEPANANVTMLHLVEN